MLSLSMPEPILSLSMLIRAKSRQARSKSWLGDFRSGPKQNQLGPKWIENQMFGLEIRVSESYRRFRPFGIKTEADNMASAI